MANSVQNTKTEIMTNKTNFYILLKELYNELATVAPDYLEFQDMYKGLEEFGYLNPQDKFERFDSFLLNLSQQLESIKRKFVVINSKEVDANTDFFNKLEELLANIASSKQDLELDETETLQIQKDKTILDELSADEIEQLLDAHLIVEEAAILKLVSELQERILDGFSSRSVLNAKKKIEDLNKLEQLCKVRLGTLEDGLKFADFFIRPTIGNLDLFPGLHELANAISGRTNNHLRTARVVASAKSKILLHHLAMMNDLTNIKAKVSYENLSSEYHMKRISDAKELLVKMYSEFCTEKTLQVAHLVEKLNLKWQAQIFDRFFKLLNEDENIDSDSYKGTKIINSKLYSLKLEELKLQIKSFEKDYTNYKDYTIKERVSFFLKKVMLSVHAEYFKFIEQYVLLLRLYASNSNKSLYVVVPPPYGEFYKIDRENNDPLGFKNLASKLVKKSKLGRNIPNLRLNISSPDGLLVGEKDASLQLKMNDQLCEMNMFYSKFYYVIEPELRNLEILISNANLVVDSYFLGEGGSFAAPSLEHDILDLVKKIESEVLASCQELSAVGLEKKGILIAKTNGTGVKVEGVTFNSPAEAKAQASAGMYSGYSLSGLVTFAKSKMQNWKQDAPELSRVLIR